MVLTRAFMPVGVALLAALPAMAEDLLPAPDYFIVAAMETSTAQLLAVRCPTLSIHLGKASARTEDVLQRLTEDGFEAGALDSRMADPSEAIAELQRAFIEKHTLQGDVTQDQVCAAGQREIADATGIGTLLIGEAQ